MVPYTRVLWVGRIGSGQFAKMYEKKLQNLVEGKREAKDASWVLQPDAAWLGNRIFCMFLCSFGFVV